MINSRGLNTRVRTGACDINITCMQPSATRLSSANAVWQAKTRTVSVFFSSFVQLCRVHTLAVTTTRHYHRLVRADITKKHLCLIIVFVCPQPEVKPALCVSIGEGERVERKSRIVRQNSIQSYHARTSAK
jgi:hypothetical protein